MRAINQRLARIPVWVASVLVLVSLLSMGSYAAAAITHAGERVEVAKVQASEAKTETAEVKAELTQRNRALAEANERLRQVGEEPVDPDKPQPPVLTAPVVALAAYVTEWRNYG